MRYKWGRIGFVFNVIFVDAILSHINEYQFIHKCGCCVIYQWGRFGLLSTIWVGAVSVSIMIVEAVSMRPFRHARRSVGPWWVGAVSVEAVSGGAVLVMSYFGAVWVEAVSEWGRFDQLPYNHRMITLVYQSVSHTLSTTYHPKFSVVIIWKIKGLNSNSQSSKKFWLFFSFPEDNSILNSQLGFRCLAPPVDSKCYKGPKRGGRNYTFRQILTKNGCRNTAFPPFCSNIRVETIQIFQRPEKGGRNGGAHIVTFIEWVPSPGRYTYSCTLVFLGERRTIKILYSYSRSASRKYVSRVSHWWS